MSLSISVIPGAGLFVLEDSLTFLTLSRKQADDWKRSRMRLCKLFSDAQMTQLKPECNTCRTCLLYDSGGRCASPVCTSTFVLMRGIGSMRSYGILKVPDLHVREKVKVGSLADCVQHVCALMDALLGEELEVVPMSCQPSFHLIITLDRVCQGKFHGSFFRGTLVPLIQLTNKNSTYGGIIIISDIMSEAHGLSQLSVKEQQSRRCVGLLL